MDSVIVLSDSEDEVLGEVLPPCKVAAPGDEVDEPEPEPSVDGTGASAAEVEVGESEADEGEVRVTLSEEDLQLCPSEDGSTDQDGLVITSENPASASSSFGPGGAERKAQKAQKAQADIACGLCGGAHAARKCIRLSACQDRVGIDCLRHAVDTCIGSGSRAASAPSCPTCGTGISWSDIQHAVGHGAYARYTEKLRTGLETVWGQQSFVCKHPTGKGECGRAVRRKQANMSATPAFATLMCSRPACSTKVCGACGDAFDQATMGQDLLHTCPAALVLRIYTHLQGLQKLGQEHTTKRGRANHSKGKGQSTAWSKGIGYGGGSESLNTSVVELAHKREREEDEKTAAIFDSLAADIALFSKHPKISNPEKGCAFHGALGPMALQAALFRSCLESVIYRLLRNDSLIDVINARSRVYLALLGLMEAMSRDNLFLLVLNTSNPYSLSMRGISATPLLPEQPAPSPSGRAGSKRKAPSESLETQLAEEVDAAEEEEEKNRTSVLQLLSALQKQGRILQRQMGRAGSSEVAMEQAVDPLGVVPRIDATSMLLGKAIKALPFHLCAKSAISLDDEVTAAPKVPEDPKKAEEEARKAREAAYIEEMKPLQFRMVQMDYASHAFKSEINSSSLSTTKKDRIRRITQEISSLSSSLPLHYDSSIFLRVDESRPDVLRALLIGPEGTPYANGCFIFDIFLPPNYPEVSPKVLLTTTGGGRVRFNPNLYKCGKVCLSLLGTWQGPGWDPKHSTLLQVLLSIQSLILVEEPIYNEPGYERSKLTDDSERYNRALRFHTLNTAILGHLQQPSMEFNAVIRKHLSAKREAIENQIQAALEDAASSTKSVPKFSGSLGYGFNALAQIHQMLHSSIQTVHDLSPPSSGDLEQMSNLLRNALELQQIAQTGKEETILLE